LSPRVGYALVKCQEICLPPWRWSHRSRGNTFLLVIQRDLVGIEVGGGRLGICGWYHGWYRLIVILTNYDFVGILLDRIRWEICWSTLIVEERCLEFDMEVGAEPPIRLQRLQKFKQRG